MEQNEVEGIYIVAYTLENFNQSSHTVVELIVEKNETIFYKEILASNGIEYNSESKLAYGKSPIGNTGSSRLVMSVVKSFNQILDDKDMWEQIYMKYLVCGTILFDRLGNITSKRNEAMNLMPKEKNYVEIENISELLSIAQIGSFTEIVASPSKKMK